MTPLAKLRLKAICGVVAVMTAFAAVVFLIISFPNATRVTVGVVMVITFVGLLYNVVYDFLEDTKD